MSDNSDIGCAVWIIALCILLGGCPMMQAVTNYYDAQTEQAKKAK